MNTPWGQNWIGSARCRVIQLSALVLAATFFGSLHAEALFSGGTGQPEDPYLIGSVSDWMELTQATQTWTRCFRITTNLDFNGAVLDPVGNRFPWGNFPFRGVMDGAGHTLSNYRIYGSGLFGWIEHALIKNLHVAGVNSASAYSPGDAVSELCGGLVRYAFRSLLMNIQVQGQVTGGLPDLEGMGEYGLLAADVSFSTILDCHASGSVVANSTGAVRNAGGLVGRVDNTRIVMSSFQGSVSGSPAGGLVGVLMASSVVSRCYVTQSTVTGGDCLGLLAGEIIAESWIEESFAQGSVDGGMFLGGLAGRGGLIRDSFALADITGRKAYIGGLAGMGTTLERTFFSGTLTVYDFARHIVTCGSNRWETPLTLSCSGVSPLIPEELWSPTNRWYYDEQTECSHELAYSFEGRSTVGGLVGRSDESPVLNSYWDGDICALPSVFVNPSYVSVVRSGAVMRTYPYDSSVYDGWPWGDVWMPDTNNINGGYPILAMPATDNVPPWIHVDDVVVSCAPASGLPVYFSAGVYDDTDAMPQFSYTIEPGSWFMPGTTTIWVTAQDSSGNFTSESFTVVVMADQSPEVTWPSDLWLSATGSLTYVNLGLPAVADDCDPNPAISNNAPAEFLFPAGSTPVTWWVTDSAGHTATHVQQVYVADSAQGWVGTGTSNDPYRIYTVEDWQRVVATPSSWGSHFALMTNLDFQGAVLTPVGTWETPFSGFFDGMGHVLSNMQVVLDYDSVGVFGYVVGGRISNLGVDGVRVQGNGAVGGLVGELENGEVLRCFARRVVVEGEEGLGGLVGFGNQAIIRESFAYIVLTNDQTSADAVGGLVGALAGTVVEDCYAMGRVCGNAWVGGFMGVFMEGTINRCYSRVEVHGQNELGGFIGAQWTESGERYVWNSYWDMQVALLTNSAGGEGWLTQNLTYPYEGPVYAGWDFTYVWQNDITGALNDGYPILIWQLVSGREEYSCGGDGSAQNPYRICTTQDWFRFVTTPFDWDKHFVLESDLDFGGTTVPMPGDPDGVAFSGTFDGQGHVLRNLRLVSVASNDDVGVFRYVQGGQIRNLGVENVTASGVDLVGGLIGWLEGGSVSRCFVRGTISGRNGLGGLVGVVAGGGVIEESFADVTVTNGDSFIGGLVGGILGGSVVRDSYSKGLVTGNMGIGGLVGGFEAGLLERCYSYTHVSGASELGGLVGSLLGEPENIAVSNSYWDVEESGQSDSMGGEGRLSDDLKLPYAGDVYLGWDFETTWAHDEGGLLNNGYPILSWQMTISNGEVVISGRIVHQISGAGVEGARVLAEGIGEVFTTEDGYYTLRVPRGWSGHLIVSYGAAVFAAGTQSLANLTADLPDQNFSFTWGERNPSVPISHLEGDDQSGSVTLYCSTEAGLYYDVFYSDDNYSDTMRWSKLAGGLPGDGGVKWYEDSSLGTQTMRRFYTVVLAGEAPGMEEVYGIIRSEVASGFTLLAPALRTDRRFDGEMGQMLARALEGADDGLGGVGDEVYVLGSNGTWRALWLDGEGRWREADGTMSSLELGAGMGMYVKRTGSGSRQISFMGKVGNDGTREAKLITGWNLLGLSEGREVRVGDVLNEVAQGGATEDASDLVVIQDEDGRWHRFMYVQGWGAPYDGHWFDLTTYSVVSDNTLIEPGAAFYYLRRGPETSIRF